MEKEILMKEIEANVKSCDKCRLCKTATNAVPGEGNINSKVIFIGEAPGHYEDISGKPFVGRAGKLLDISLNEIGYKREDIWIGNIIKHRPPENRQPLPDEISACSPFLNLQLKAISPIMVVTLGRYSMNYFYPNGKISLDRGNLIKVGKYYIYPVYHPAAALRSTNVLLEFKKDFNKIPEMLIKAEELLKNQDLENGQNSSLEILDGQIPLDL
ncbi:uracil-DNA glycosylase [Patescibacteria group bacterium]|nr:uracil-DNA glycosylase [Patescibacteria group bacterium]